MQTHPYMQFDLMVAQRDKGARKFLDETAQGNLPETQLKKWTQNFLIFIFILFS